MFRLEANQWTQAVMELTPVPVAPPSVVKERPTPRPSSRPSASTSGGRAGESRTFSLPGGASIEMVWISAGTFTMGTSSSQEQALRSGGIWQDWMAREQPAHPVTISKGFWLGKYEVTQAQWKSVMGSKPSYYKGSNRPVEQVSWEDVQGFIEKLNQAEGRKIYRLPTEAQWENAARAGTSSMWPFGNSESQLGSYAWYSGNNTPSGTKEVGRKQANAWELHDMLGNVYEWCEDWYGAYPSGSQTDPTGAASGSYRVFRGGVFSGDARYVRPAFRDCGTPSGRSGYVGFRLLRTP